MYKKYINTSIITICLIIVIIILLYNYLQINKIIEPNNDKQSDEDKDEDISKKQQKILDTTLPPNNFDEYKKKLKY